VHFKIAELEHGEAGAVPVQNFNLFEVLIQYQFEL
jgi:hypothetical protein